MRQGEPPSLFLLLASGLALTLLYKLIGLVSFTMLGQPRMGLAVAPLAGILLPLAILLRSSPDWAALVRARRASALSLLLGTLTAVAAMPAVLALASLVTRDAPHVDRFFVELLRARTPADLVILLLAAALLPAIAEETLFRGFLLTGLERRFGRVRAIVATAAWFGAVHGAERGPGAFLVGILLGWLTLRTNSVLPAITAHFAINVVAILLANGWIAGSGNGFADVGVEVARAPEVLAFSAAVAALCALVFARATRR